MNDLVVEIIKLIVIVPIAYGILKLIFKKSIMFKVSFMTIGLVLFTNLITSIQFFTGIFPFFTGSLLSIGVGILVYYRINSILKKPLEDSINQVKEISEGNLDLELIELKSTNELGILNNALITLSNNLKGIITEVSNNALNLSNASQEMSGASEQLSEGASEQASSIEEVSATMEQMSANIEQNTTNAQQTEKVSVEANNSIKQVVEKSVKAAEANRAISEKITIINDIAFQTNILALNAAVEAARAGEHGKGFAVVASEVRKLAENSKKAAEEIVNLAKSGLGLTEEARDLMMDAIPKIENTSKLIQEITAASIEQNTGAMQVNSAIQELNSVTQQNAASSEQLASNAASLAEQADILKTTISFFNTGENQKQFKTTKSIKKTVNISSTQITKTPVKSFVQLNMNNNMDNEFTSY
jgi:methyl-accepting chemotaxis protein